MKCLNCGAEFEGKFCSNCGTPVPVEEKVHTLIKCAQCGTEFEGKYCPSCGESAAVNAQASSKSKKTKPKKPIYKRVWFIVLAAIVLISIISRISNGIGDNKAEKISWSDVVLGDMLPKPKYDKGVIMNNSKENLWIQFKKADDSVFREYVNECVEMGYSIDAEDSTGHYSAYNEDGYELILTCYDGEMTIDLNQPIEFSKIQWPESPLVSCIPTPKSSDGKINNESDTGFSALIGNTSIDDYNDYVSECLKNGFDVDYNRDEKTFFAKNEEGYSLTVLYKGFNTMSVDIIAPKLDKESIKAENATEETAEPKETAELDANGLRPEFKKAMDSYEQFMDEYVDFMGKYEDNPSDLTLLAEYADFMSKYAKFCEEFEKWDDEEMNDAETAYYIAVQGRVSQKLLEVAG